LLLVSGRRTPVAIAQPGDGNNGGAQRDQLRGRQLQRRKKAAAVVGAHKFDHEAKAAV